MPTNDTFHAVCGGAVRSRATDWRIKRWKAAANCLAHGASDCASGLCARVSGAQALCTHLCDKSAPCEVGWQCKTMGPGSSKFWCLPEVAKADAP